MLDAVVALSDSNVQQLAEPVILARVSTHVGAALTPRTLTLPGGARVQVDGAADDLSVLVEVFARHGALKGGQQKKVCQDALKLITLRRTYPSARLILAFAGSDAARYASRGTWVAEALGAWDVEVLVVAIDASVSDDIRAAQVRQTMVNQHV